MAEDQQIEKTVDIMEMFQRAQPIESAVPSAPCLVNERSLALEGNNSLALMARHSIEGVLPIPRNMLSRSEDAFSSSQDPSYQQKQEQNSQLQPQPINEPLNLTDLLEEEQENTFTENTKNVLRNFGNAQNHYSLYHSQARKYIQDNISDHKAFDDWVRSLKLQNFVNFKKAWGAQQSRLFTRVYKKLCWDFYTQNAIPYVLSSRIKKSETRNSHLRYIFRFLEGLRNPEDFTYFRKP